MWKNLSIFLVLLSMFTLAVKCSAKEIGGVKINEAFQSKGIVTLISKACEGKIDEVQKLIKDKVNVNERGKDGITALFWVLTCDTSVGMKVLLENGADPNLTLKDGSSVILFAAIYENSDYLKLLLEAEANPNLAAKGHRKTPLINAFKLGAKSNAWTNFDLLIDSNVDLFTGKGIHADENIAAYGVKTYGKYCKALELVEKKPKLINPYLFHVSKLRKVGSETQSLCRQELLNLLADDVSENEYKEFLNKQGW